MSANDEVERAKAEALKLSDSLLNKYTEKAQGFYSEMGKLIFELGEIENSVLGTTRISSCKNIEDVSLEEILSIVSDVRKECQSRFNQ